MECSIKSIIRGKKRQFKWEMVIIGRIFDFATVFGDGKRKRGKPFFLATCFETATEKYRNELSARESMLHKTAIGYAPIRSESNDSMAQTKGSKKNCGRMVCSIRQDLIDNSLWSTRRTP